MSRIATLVLLSVLCGCPASDDENSTGDAGEAGGTSSGSGTGGSPCPSHLAWQMKCNAEDPGSVEQPYWGESECPMLPWKLMQPALIRAMSDCFATLPCTSSDDTCSSAGYAAIGIKDETDLASDALYQRCIERTHVCDVLDDMCTVFIGFTKQGRTLAAKCLDLECPSLEACLKDPTAP